MSKDQIESTDIDIRASANRIVEHLKNGQVEEAFTLLDQQREGQRPAVKEALDRYVHAGAESTLEGLGKNPAVAGDPEQAAALDRLQQAGEAPRMPNPGEELAGLSEAQKYDIYASIVQVRGNQAARDALTDGDSVLLGLREETRTTESMDGKEKGTGVYDDQLIVLRQDAQGNGHVHIADRANTDPTAQYDAHARVHDGRAEHFDHVKWRRAEGEDVNKDKTADLGRMAEGTIEMVKTDHPNPASAGTREAFRPSPEQLQGGRAAGLVERDTNGDGYFNSRDTDGVQDLNRTFKIHSGSRANTDSAGCQTIHPDEFKEFMRQAQANPDQTRWQYVLTSTGPGIEANLDREEQSRQAGDAELSNAHGQAQQGQAASGPFGNPFLDRYLAAAEAGNLAQANAISVEFAHSAEGGRMLQQGMELQAEQARAEQSRQQESLHRG